MALSLGSIRVKQGPALAVWRCETALDRMRGLLGRPPLQLGQGLWIEPCASIHMFGMGYAIDVAFLSGDGKVLKLVPHVRPWAVASCWGARTAFEMASGQIQASAMRVGDTIEWVRQ